MFDLFYLLTMISIHISQPAMLEKLCDEQDKQVHPSLSVKEPWLTP